MKLKEFSYYGDRFCSYNHFRKPSFIEYSRVRGKRMLCKCI